MNNEEMAQALQAGDIQQPAASIPVEVAIRSQSGRDPRVTSRN
ncbi:hypothetical protein [Sediminivirga luteola]|nr:hypothetical protein [Sediminivirga luteola]